MRKERSCAIRSRAWTGGPGAPHDLDPFPTPSCKKSRLGSLRWSTRKTEAAGLDIWLLTLVWISKRTGHEAIEETLLLGKRVTDLVGSAAALVVLSPVFLLARNLSRLAPVLALGVGRSRAACGGATWATTCGLGESCFARDSPSRSRGCVAETPRVPGQCDCALR